MATQPVSFTSTITSTTALSASATRANLGPLTTTWTAPSICNQAWLACSDCDYAWQGQACNGDGSNSDTLSCWPPIATSLSSVVVAPFLGLGFYSPGIACPTGYTTACAMQGAQNGLQTPVAGSQQFQFGYAPTLSETAIGCCPTGYACASNGGYQTCSQQYAATVETMLSCSSGASAMTTAVSLPETLTATSGSSIGQHIISEFTIWAPMYQLNHQATDLPSSSLSSSATSTISSSSSSSSTGPSQAASTQAENNGKGSNTNTTTVAVAVVIPCVVVAILAALGWFWYRRRQSRKQHDYQAAGQSSPPAAELFAQSPPVEMSSALSRFEMPSDSVTANSPGAKGIVHEMDAS